MHLLITDSGLGGLSICADIERELRKTGRPRDVRITYFNAWPEAGRGYNDLPDMPARARVFERVLHGMAELRPDLILIACNTLSIVYELTRFRAAEKIPVQGIVDAGVDLFYEALRGQPGSSLVLLGTRTTVESGVHRDRLLQRGVAPERVTSAPCHGLATAIESGPGGDTVSGMIESCTEWASEVRRMGEPLYAGLVCTHYGMVSDRIAAALRRRTGRTVLTLDPNQRVVSQIVPRIGNGGTPAGESAISVEVVSKVEIGDERREAVARLVERVSEPTAAALRSYRRVPDLF